MKLYTHTDRIYRELQERGLSLDDCLHAESDLSDLDSWHYLGTSAIRRGLEQARIGENSRVLDVGSGLGGPARLLALWTNCQVEAVELQEDSHEVASKLTERCGLSDRVHHICGDILELDLPLNSFDALVSWLVFLHIPDTPRLFQRCHSWLKPGGYLYVEDFYQRGDFTNGEQESLARDVYVNELPTWKALEQNLLAADFEIVEMLDMTEAWTSYVGERWEVYQANHDRHERVHGADGATSLAHFYRSVHDLFQGGNLGGVAYTVRKR